MKIALDANAYSDWRRSGTWNEEIQAATLVMISTVALGELRFGFANGGKPTENESRLRSFLGESVVVVCEITDATSSIYGGFRRFLKANGTPISTDDIWIGASAFEHEAELLTSDQHFRNLPQVRVKWPKREEEVKMA